MLLTKIAINQFFNANYQTIVSNYMNIQREAGGRRQEAGENWLGDCL
ncbi:hypothetical protein [Sphaerospermopsis sp. FACHB-1194]|nr:hypothetical protein [Sphaerospermopsis sp. FACHB-1194]